MKAKEYFEKYDALIVEDVKNNSTKNTTKLVIELSTEVETLYKARKGNSNSALAGCIREVNDKWNAIARMFSKKYGGEIFVKDGIINFWTMRIPELKDIL